MAGVEFKTGITGAKAALQMIMLTVVLMAVLTACKSTGGKKEATLGSLSQDVILVKAEPLPQASVQEARLSYQRFLESTDNQELRARAMERLADLQLERQQEKRSVAEERKVFTPTTSINQKTIPKREHVEPGLNNRMVSADDENYQNVAGQYEELINRFPHSKDNERILYQLARAYDLTGESEKALAALTHLIRDFPETKRIEEVEFRRGEILFSLRKYKKAVQAYRAILHNRQSEYYERALYKQGWAQFKLNRLDEASKYFYRLLDYHFQNGKQYEQFTRSEKEILDDTFRVVSLSHSYQQGSESIQRFSRKFGQKPYEHILYERLSELYLRQDRTEDAAATLKSYTARFPSSVQAPLFFVKVIEIFEKGGFPKAVTEAKEEFVSQYGIGKPFWSRQDRELLGTISPHIKKNIEDLAEHYLALGLKDSGVGNLKNAIHWYREYIRSFPRDQKAAEMNFLLAESLLAVGDYGAAASEFEKTSYNYSAFDKSAEAGYAAILAYKKQLSEMRDDRARQDKQMEIITASLNFSDHYPEDKRVPTVLLKVAEDFVNLKQYKDAITVGMRLTKLKEKQPGEHKKLYLKSWAILAASYFELKDYEAAESATLKRLALGERNDPDRNDHIERLAAAVYQQGDAARQAGDAELAAKHFLRIADLAPGASIRVTAEYDAAVVLAKSENWDRSIPVFNRFLQLYPYHEFAGNITRYLALAYEKTGKLTNAAAVYVDIYRREKDPEKKRLMILQTADMYEKVKKIDMLVGIYKEYISLFPDPTEEAVETRLKLADIYKAQSKLNKRRYWLNEIITADKDGKSTERTRFLAANATLELAEPTFKKYQNVKLVLPLKENLKKKKKLLNLTIEAYTNAANYGVQKITTASTYRIAEVYRDFSRGLFDSERPKGLSPEELEEYDLLIEEQAYPFEEKAIKIHETNTGRASDGVYDEWVEKSFSALKKLNPVRYGKTERSDVYAVNMN
ncbi:MAG: tetratricopeptide repeat protein [Gammaproteobacteria bacterium]|nr:tetratricopeptide repeat protein [Gammaproteobacteria bacterium]MDH5802070.1 tetratricopeptide repeat protein [Gammaproteobacteria bacterium]